MQMSKADTLTEMTKFMARKGVTDDELMNFGKILVKNAYMNYDYMRCVFFPEASEPSRYPQLFPVPSALIKQHDSFFVKTNSSGNTMIQFSPNARFSHTASYNDDVYAIIANGNLLNMSTSNLYDTSLADTISAPSNSWWGNTGDTFGDKRMRFNTNATCEASIAKYRIVAFGINITYIGQLDDHSGLLECAFFPDNLSEDFIYLNHADTEDAMFYKKCIPMNGIRAISFPIDPTTITYNDVGKSINNLGMLQLNLIGLPINATCVHIDVTRVLEHIPVPSMREIINTEVGESSGNAYEKMTEAVKQKPELASSELKSYKGLEGLKMPGTKTHDWLGRLNDISYSIKQVMDNPLLQNAISNLDTQAYKTLP